MASLCYNTLPPHFPTIISMVSITRVVVVIESPCRNEQRESQIPRAKW